VSALAIAAIESPDFIVVDVAVDDDAGLDHISDLVQVAKHVLVISDICEETLINCVRQAGATDLVPREQVVAAIMRRLGPHREGIDSLTEQEMVVCELVSRGLSNKRIAEHLFISEAVVYEALVSILRKLKVRDRFELRIYTLYRDLACAE
jgi:DNA-binding NarL/FixJ family response regulator